MCSNLEDYIWKQAAMALLISERVKVEISKKAAYAYLQAMANDDWQSDLLPVL